MLRGLQNQFLKATPLVFNHSYLDVVVVGDDAVVDNNELVIFSGSVGMGVGVRRGSMGCPPVNKKLTNNISINIQPCMSNSHMLSVDSIEI